MFNPSNFWGALHGGLTLLRRSIDLLWTEFRPLTDFLLGFLLITVTTESFINAETGMTIQPHFEIIGKP